MTDESKSMLGKPRRSDSQWKDAFAKAMLELDENPDVQAVNPDLGISDPINKDVNDPQTTREFLSHKQTIKRILLESRHQAASAYTVTIRDVLTKVDDKQAWKKFIHFAGDCFGKAKRGGKKARSLASHING